MRRRARLLPGLVFIATLLAPASAPAPASAADGPVEAAPIASGRVLVKFKPTASASARDGARARASARRARSVSKTGIEVLTVEAGREWAAVFSLRSEPSVLYAEPDYKRKAFAHVAGEIPWGVATVKAPQVWDAPHSLTGAGVIVAVLDSGVDYTHPDLAAAIAENPGETGLDGGGVDRRVNGIDDDGNGHVDDWRGWDFVSLDSDPIDDLGHGTAVAGVVAASHDGLGLVGVAPDAKILPVKVLDGDGYGEDSEIVAGIAYAADRGAKIINLSLGGPMFSQSYADAVSYADSKGALVVAAAGNSGNAAVAFPAGLAEVLSVGATDSANAWAPFSQYGKVDVAAPGDDVVTADLGGGTTVVDGTSFASPHAAGVAALLAQKYPNASGRRLRQILAGTAVDIGAAGNDAKTGAGLIDALAAASNTEPLMTLSTVPRLIATGGASSSRLLVSLSGPDGLYAGGEQHVTFAGEGVTPAAAEATTVSGPLDVLVSSTASPGTLGRLSVAWTEQGLERTVDFKVVDRDDDVPGRGIWTPVSGLKDTLGAGDPRDAVAFTLCDAETLRIEVSSAGVILLVTVYRLDGGDSVHRQAPIGGFFADTFPAAAQDAIPAAGSYAVVVEAFDPQTWGPPSPAKAYSLTLSRPAKISNLRVSPAYLSPNGDGRNESSTISFTAAAAGTLTGKVLTAAGAVVATKPFGSLAAGSARSFVWTPRAADGRALANGRYLAVVEWSGGCVYHATWNVFVDTAKPLVWNVNDTDPFYPYPDKFKDATRIWFTLGEPALAQVRIYAYGSARAVRVLGAWKPGGIQYLDWDGRDSSGRLVGAGTYQYQFYLTDWAGNVHQPASARFGVAVSGKRIAGRTAKMTLVATRAAGYYFVDEAGCNYPELQPSARYAGGVWLLTGDCNGRAADEMPVLVYRFTAPSAAVYYSMKTVVYGGSAGNVGGDPSTLLGIVRNWSGSTFDLLGSGGVLGDGFTWHGFGWQPAPGHISKDRLVEIHLALADGNDRDVNEDFDLAYVELHLTYGVLV